MIPVFLMVIYHQGIKYLDNTIQNQHGGDIHLRLRPGNLRMSDGERW